jgi:arylsulfatase A-like enzyme
MCQHKAPHRNWRPAERHARAFAGRKIQPPATFDDDYSTRSDAAREQNMTIENALKVPGDTKIKPPAGLSGRALKLWKYQRYMEDYLACVAGVDESVGRILDWLDSSGLSQNTIVLYTSDQGFFLGEHGWFDKRFMYEESLRMPLLMRWPGKIEPGAVSGEIVLNIDFAPTLLDLAGVAIGPDIQGASFRPLLSGDAPNDWRKSMYYHYYEYPGAHDVKRHCGVRTKQWKLMHFYYDIDAWELYDLENDPLEMNNLYGNREYAPIVKKLKTELQRLQRKYGDSEELTRRILLEDIKPSA